MNQPSQQSVELHASENPWKPSYKSKVGADCVGAQTEKTYKKVRAILNKLTPQKFDTLIKQVKELDINTEERLIGVVDLVFEKAIYEPNFSVLYANMCWQLALMRVPLDNEGCVNFRKKLLTKCQKEFEEDGNDKLQRKVKLKQIEECEIEEKKKQMQEEFEEWQRKNRRRKLGNIRFIGELFRMKLLIEPIIHECVKKLFNEGAEYSLECLCCLLTTVGKELEAKHERDSNEDYELKKAMVNDYITLIQQIVDKRKTSTRLRFMLQDVIDLKMRHWVPRRQANVPKTIDQIHREAEKEVRKQQKMLKNIRFPKRHRDDHHKTSATATAVLKGPELNEKEIEEKMRPLIHEFLHSNDSNAAARGIMDLASANTIHIVITEAVNQVLERSSQARCLVGHLLKELVVSEIVTMKQYNEGMKSVLEHVDYYSPDMPGIFEFLGQIIEPVIDANIPSLEFLKETLKPTIPSITAGKLVSAILHHAVEKRGTIEVGQMWRESSLKWSDFLPLEENESEFISSQKLEFTVGSVKPLPIESISSEEIKERLKFFLSNGSDNNEIFDWIESHIGDEGAKKHTFVRALVTSVLENSFTGNDSIDTGTLTKRMPLLTLYASGGELELQTLYAAQAFVFRCGEPRGLLKQIFDILYDYEIIMDKTFKKWEASTDPMEQEGKNVALCSVVSFMRWLSFEDDSSNLT